jgi:hypothetical protein
MGIRIISNFLRLLFLVLIQVLIICRIELLDGMMLPWIYIFGILMLHFSTPGWVVILTAFATGWSVDYFTGTGGLHASAATFLGLLQPVVQRFMAPREGYEVTHRPTVQRMGLGWYLTYAGILTFAHHFWLFFLEVLRFSGFFDTLLRVLLSTVATLVLMTVGQYLIYNTSKSADY